MPRTAPHFGDVVTVDGYQVERVHLKYMAEILRQHGVRKRLLRELEEGVILGTGKDDNRGMPRGPGVSDPTPAGMMKLDDSNEPTFRARAHMRGMIVTVQDIFEHLPLDQREIIKEIYWRRERTINGVAKLLNMTPATVCRKRNKALLAFAKGICGDHILIPLAEK